MNIKKNKVKIPPIPDAPYAEELFQTLLQLDNADDLRAFMCDVCTPREIGAISQRLHVARLLDGKHVYNDIVKMTGASTATISRVNRSLQAGSGGYDIVFKKKSP
ncbi:MAG: YerC/YecD family TrpR-related protein [Oscillospiraceae bacterium]|nr:YerC/YecD family TrpR-related protein [Oscillospiraceae bacterium]